MMLVRKEGEGFEKFADRDLRRRMNFTQEIQKMLDKRLVQLQKDAIKSLGDPIFTNEMAPTFHNDNPGTVPVTITAIAPKDAGNATAEDLVNDIYGSFY